MYRGADVWYPETKKKKYALATLLKDSSGERVRRILKNSGEFSDMLSAIKAAKAIISANNVPVEIFVLKGDTF